MFVYISQPFGGLEEEEEEERENENGRERAEGWKCRKECCWEEDRVGRVQESCIFTLLLFVKRFSTLSNYTMSKKQNSNNNQNNALLYENIFLEYDSMTHSNNSWPPNYKHYNPMIYMLADITRLCSVALNFSSVSVSPLLHILP